MPTDTTRRSVWPSDTRGDIRVLKAGTEVALASTMVLSLLSHTAVGEHSNSCATREKLPSPHLGLASLAHFLWQRNPHSVWCRNEAVGGMHIAHGRLHVWRGPVSRQDVLRITKSSSLWAPRITQQRLEMYVLVSADEQSLSYSYVYIQPFTCAFHATQGHGLLALVAQARQLEREALKDMLVLTGNI